MLVGGSNASGNVGEFGERLGKGNDQRGKEKGEEQHRENDGRGDEGRTLCICVVVAICSGCLTFSLSS